MPACLDSYPWQSLKGCGSMAPAMFKVGDYKNACLKDGTNVQFRIIGFNHDRARGGIVVPMTWEMVDDIRGIKPIPMRVHGRKHISVI